MQVQQLTLDLIWMAHFVVFQMITLHAIGQRGAAAEALLVWMLSVALADATAPLWRKPGCLEQAVVVVVADPAQRRDEQTGVETHDPLGPVEQCVVLDPLQRMSVGRWSVPWVHLLLTMRQDSGPGRAPAVAGRPLQAHCSSILLRLTVPVPDEPWQHRCVLAHWQQPGEQWHVAHLCPESFLGVSAVP